MKIKSYSISAPCKTYVKQWHILGMVTDEHGAYVCHTPLLYLQRPKWIKDDAIWETFVRNFCWCFEKFCGTFSKISYEIFPYLR